MLQELSVRNYALIENLNLSFENGLTILTGETGAGKSIIVGSLSFLLGAKADVQMIRSGAEEASVSAVLSVESHNRDALDWLTQHDIESEDGGIIVRRNIKTNGRTSIYIQNEVVSRTALQEFMSCLFDIHGQHEHESLLRKVTHRRYLDRFAGLEAETSAFNGLFNDLAEKRATLANSISNEKERADRVELLTFAIEEIDNAALKIGESKELEGESSRLASFEKLAAQVDHVCASLFDGEVCALSLLRNAKTAADNAGQIDSKFLALHQRIDALYYEADDLCKELREYRDGLSFDPARMELVEARLNELYKLKKKYAKYTFIDVRSHHASVNQSVEDSQQLGFKESVDVEEAILAYKNASLAEIDALQSSDQDREKLKKEIAAIEKDIAQRASVLTAKRKIASKHLSSRISGILARLGMPGAVFSVSLESKAGGEPHSPVSAQCPEVLRGVAEKPAGLCSEGGSSPHTSLLLGPYGADDIEFLISANIGEEPRSLSRIASGGELSRVMLAIKTALLFEDTPKDGNVAMSSERTPMGNKTYSCESSETLIFDEIDTGIGGEVALSVGEYLAILGSKKQIFCITHLASIAVRADNHLLVEKTNDGSRTITQVVNLKKDERVQEIARMLSGDKGHSALAHAQDLLEKYGRR
ncbi:MAG: DNA repair protein RecN [Termitinemataceae bacterium]|nr:MAG: DNA repair protein RecN [Termitinemataceae bacterium]